MELIARAAELLLLPPAVAFNGQLKANSEGDNLLLTDQRQPAVRTAD